LNFLFLIVIAIWLLDPKVRTVSTSTIVLILMKSVSEFKVSFRPSLNQLQLQ